MPKLKKPAAPKSEPVARAGVFVCSMCGATHTARRGNFNKLVSPTYAGNGGYCHVCMRCVNKKYEELMGKYSDEPKCVRRICEWLDVYYSPKVLEMAMSDNRVQNSLIMNYFRKSNLAQVTGTSFEDTLAEEQVKIVNGEINEVGIAKEAYDLFGDGFDTKAYSFMLKSFHSYIDPLGQTVTASQTKDAVFLSILEYKATEALKNSASNAPQLSNAYRAALKESGFDVATRSGESNEEPFGVWLREIENHAPAEYVRDHEIYKDEDKMSYFERFLIRPIGNLLRASGYVKDDELSITDEDVDADGE